MDVIKRNTDYALRAVIYLVKSRDKGPISTKEIAQKEGIPYQLACKILQQLQKKKIIKSTMGSKGGFVLLKKPSKVSLLEVIEAIQGYLTLNRCLVNLSFCPRKGSCPVSKKLTQLQNNINNFLGRVKLSSLINVNKKRRKQKGEHYGRTK